MELTITTTASAKRVYSEKLANWLRPLRNKSIIEWTIDQLQIQPYQHILEIGYTSGYTLNEVGRKLKIGFLAGIEDSMDRWLQAYRVNKKLIEEKLLQLHIGNLNELPYPHHYFHTIYSNNISALQEDPANIILQSYELLRSGGRLVTIYQPSTRVPEKEINHYTEQLKQEFSDAGLSNICTAYRDVYPTTCIAVTGYKE